MTEHMYPVRGEYVTAKIPVRDALLHSPDLMNYASSKMQLQLPGLLTPEDFPAFGSVRL